ncbi:MAG: hypothetical protein H0U55_03740 [Rubrobacteraceae bacterium]|nr:hypothetical protein [Rubrobacteraceae bacterium]
MRRPREDRVLEHIGNLSEPENSRAFAWVELSSEPTEESRMRVGEREWRSINASLAELTRLAEPASPGEWALCLHPFRRLD